MFQLLNFAILKKRYMYVYMYVYKTILNSNEGALNSFTILFKGPRQNSLAAVPIFNAIHGFQML